MSGRVIVAVLTAVWEMIVEDGEEQSLLNPFCLSVMPCTDVPQFTSCACIKLRSFVPNESMCVVISFRTSSNLESRPSRPLSCASMCSDQSDENLFDFCMSLCCRFIMDSISLN